MTKSSRSITQRQESTNPETILGNFLQNQKAQPEREAGSICSVLLLLLWECRSSDYFWYETCMHSSAIKMLQALSVHNAWEELLYRQAQGNPAGTSGGQSGTDYHSPVKEWESDAG